MKVCLVNPLIASYHVDSDPFTTVLVKPVSFTGPNVAFLVLLSIKHCVLIARFPREKIEYTLILFIRNNSIGSRSTDFL